MGFAAIESVGSSDSVSPLRTQSAPAAALHVSKSSPAKSLAAIMYDRISAATLGLPSLIPTLGEMMPALGLDFLTESNAEAAVRDLQNRPAHTVSTLLSLSLRAPYIERGKDAAVFPLARYPDLVLRVTHKLSRLPNAVKVVPVRYDAPLQTLSRHAAFGLVRAVIVDAQGPLRARHSLSIHEAATTPAAMQLMLLNYCAGRQASAAFNHAFLTFSLSPPGRNIVRAHRQAVQRANRPVSTTETVRDGVERERAGSAADGLRRRLERLQLTPEARAHHALYDSLKTRVTTLLECGNADDYRDARDTAAHFLTRTQTGTIYDATGHAVAATALGQFTRTYTGFVQAYGDHVAMLAALPQAAFDGAVSALALTHSLPNMVNVNLNHSGNTLIDAQRGAIHFVDLDFAKLYDRPHIDALALVLLGKDRLVHRPWQAVLGAQDRATLAPKVTQIFKKLALAGRRGRMAWPADDCLKIKQIFWHFDLPNLIFDDLPFGVSRIALAPHPRR